MCEKFIHLIVILISILTLKLKLKWESQLYE